VLVLHDDEREWVNGGERRIALKRVLVAYDFSDYSELALTLGLLIAQEYQAELHLLHVLPPFTLDEPEITWYPLGKEGIYHKAARRLQRRCRTKRICGARSRISSAKVNLIERLFITPNTIRSI